MTYSTKEAVERWKVSDAHGVECFPEKNCYECDAFRHELTKAYEAGVKAVVEALKKHHDLPTPDVVGCSACGDGYMRVAQSLLKDK